jgi:hypothetical protein
MGKPEGKKPLGGPSLRRDDWIRIDLIVRETGWGLSEFSWLIIGTGGVLL